VVDKHNHHLFQPMLYQVATAGLSESDIASPIRSVLRLQTNTQVLLGEVTEVRPNKREISLVDGSSLNYDYLIIAAGARHSYFGHDDWEILAPGLKSLEDADEIRRRILLAFERAEREPDATRRHPDLRSAARFPPYRSTRSNCDAAGGRAADSPGLSSGTESARQGATAAARGRSAGVDVGHRRASRL